MQLERSAQDARAAQSAHLIPQAHAMQFEHSAHALDAGAVIREFDTSVENGLSTADAAARLRRFGPNEIRRRRTARFAGLLWDQIKSPLVVILFGAGAASFWLGDTADAIIIVSTIAINTAIGIWQEGRASHAFEKLRSSLETHAVVLRDGHEIEIHTEEVVPGDLLIIQDGDRVAADARLIEARGLEINESALTGEWAPVPKSAGTVAESARVPERADMVWMGTLVTEGRAKAVVVATGNATEFGRIAVLVASEKREATLFQQGVAGLARTIGILVGAVVVLTFILGVLRGNPAHEMFLTSVAVAVASIPEGLPVAVTVVLAIGMLRILKAGGLVRKLIAAETLGSTSVILTDKTGTLTTGEMRVASVVTATQTLAPYASMTPDAREALSAGARASAAFVENPEADVGRWIVRGKPTDRAMLMAGIESGIRPDDLERELPRLDFLPFDAERRYSASLHKTMDGNRLYFSGAPEAVLERSARILRNGQEMDLAERERRTLLDANQTAAERGMRIIAVARRNADAQAEIERGEDGFHDITFLGLIVFRDPIRPDVPDVIRRSQEAGIRTVIMTGDHAATARAVAEECGLDAHAGDVIEGPALEGKTDEELAALVPTVAVFARVLPHQKLSIANAWKANGAVVAMTGDGVNDAPALQGADIGIAIGSGTDVAKEASDLVLLEDSFRVIVRAIEEGRVILDNLRKIVTYLLAANFSEIVLIGGALAFGLPLPILPAQILWANIAEEGLMNFALAFEPAERDLLRRNPKPHSSKKLLTPEMLFLIFGVGIITSVFLFGIYGVLLAYGLPIGEIRTVMFVGIALDALFFSFSFKSLRQPIWRIPLFTNRYFLVAFAASILFLAAAIYVPPLAKLLELSGLHPLEFGALGIIGLFNLAAVELAKWVFIVRSRRRMMEL